MGSKFRFGKWESESSFFDFEKIVIDRGIYIRSGVILSTLEFILDRYGNLMNENDISGVENGKRALENWRRILKTENVSVILFIEKGDSAAPAITSAILSIVQAFNNSIVGMEQVVEIEPMNISEKSLRAVDCYMPGYIAAFIMTNGVIGVASATSEFRRNGILKRMAATPLMKKSWILANLLLQVFLAFSLTIIMVLLGRFIFGTQGLPNVYSVILILLGSVAFCTVGITIGSAVRDIEAATAAGNLVAFPMMFLSGAFWPVEMMPEIMQTIARCMPLYYFHDGLRQAMLFGNFVVQSFFLLGILSIFFIILAVKLTKWKEI